MAIVAGLHVKCRGLYACYTDSHILCCRSCWHILKIPRDVNAQTVRLQSFKHTYADCKEVMLLHCTINLSLRACLCLVSLCVVGSIAGT